MHEGGWFMKRKAVFFGTKQRIDGVYSTLIQQELAEYADIYPETINRENLDKHAADLQSVEVVFSTWGMPVITEEEIKRYLPNLKALFYSAGSVQSFARPFLNCNVAVVSAWAANAIPVAEYTAAQIVLANKGFHQTSAMCKGNRDEASKYSHTFPGNYGVKVGIIGAGMIGKKVIELLKPYHLEIYVFDPYMPDDAAERLRVKKTDLIEIFSQCQTISNHLANLPALVGILNKEHFDRMLPNATFINTGRGKQVVEADLIKALHDVPTRTAILDVTFPEPVRSDSEFLKMDNVLLTPHMAGSNKAEVGRMAEYIVEEFRRYLNQEQLLYQVSHKMLETMA
ncbi:hydroxyacid dehydrogenase [Paenibacillus mesophilus]|uniref:hydroxyacid dehydrogenase n=1 Tax=Paenibacillus mesophilus TaxID=2582849 RepID=UPI00110D7F8B|nr:hydroxyacid dehydrogenase [Paenibacillus mesophilus]TMV46320.1 hydroxyacid dehydrogenase [Paenibacillus mesophilus]